MHDKNVLFLVVFGMGLVALAFVFAFYPSTIMPESSFRGESGISGGVKNGISAGEIQSAQDHVAPVVSFTAPPSSTDELLPIIKYLKEKKLPDPPKTLVMPKSLAENGAGTISLAPSQKALTEQEIFDRVWPKEYRINLMKVQRLVIHGGIVGGDMKIAATGSSTSGTDVFKEWEIPVEEYTSLSTDEEVLKTLMSIAREAYAQGIIDEKEFRAAEHGINDVLPDTIKAERRGFAQGGKSGILLPRDQHFSQKNGTRQFIYDLMEGVIYTLLQVEPAYAQWVTNPDCYKDDNPNYNTVGFNGWAFCCNCGIKIYVCGDSCCEEWHDDCGENNRDCEGDCGTIKLGCLNLVCENWPNAIWDRLDDGADYPNPTGICGCG